MLLRIPVTQRHCWFGGKLKPPDMGRSHGEGDNFEKCSVKFIVKLNLSTNYIFHTRLTMSLIIHS